MKVIFLEIISFWLINTITHINCAEAGDSSDKDGKVTDRVKTFFTNRKDDMSNQINQFKQDSKGKKAAKLAAMGVIPAAVLGGSYVLHRLLKSKKKNKNQDEDEEKLGNQPQNTQEQGNQYNKKK